MTVKEAIEKLCTYASVNGSGLCTQREFDEAKRMGIEALEKWIPKKPTDISKARDGEGYIGLIGKCPCCDEILEEDTVYCDCGQKLDWGD